VDHGSFFHVNLFLTVVFPLVMVFPAYLAWIRRQVKTNAVQLSVEGGGSLAVSGADTLTRTYGAEGTTPIGTPRRQGSRVESSIAGSASPRSYRNPVNVIRRYSTNQGGQFH
jgi:hypothetical protein